MNITKTVRPKMEEGGVYREFLGVKNGIDIADPNAPALTLIGGELQFVELDFFQDPLQWRPSQAVPQGFKLPFRLVKVGEISY